MKYAVVKIGGSQYKIAENDELSVEKIDGEKSSLIIFNEVLLFVDEQKLEIGKPFLKNIQVRAKIIDQYKDKKIRVGTYKAKSRYRRVIGYRKQLTKIKIEKIVLGEIKKSSTTKKRK